MKPALNPKQAKTKDAYLRRHYSITLDEYNCLRVWQNYCCSICREPESKFKNGMAVDHDHKTGRVRGLLCWQCNRKLGKWQDNDEHLIRASFYVQHSPARLCLGRDVMSAPGRVGSAKRNKLIAKLNGTPTPKRRAPRGKRKSAKRTRTKRTQAQA